MKKSHMSTEARALREEAVKLSLSGVSNAAIARQLKVARSSVNRWITSYKITGIQGIDIHLGRPSKLTQEQTAQVLAHLTAGPEACGYDTPLWNLARIADMITKTTGVRFNSNYVSEWMHGLGWTCQKPERRAKERDEESIKNWVQTTWPEIKKKPKS